MLAAKTWRVEIFLSEEDSETRARATLDTGMPTKLIAEGFSRKNPHDLDVPEIGDEVAAARALMHLGEQLLATAQTDISTATGEPAGLSG